MSNFKIKMDELAVNLLQLNDYQYDLHYCLHDFRDYKEGIGYTDAYFYITPIHNITQHIILHY